LLTGLADFEALVEGADLVSEERDVFGENFETGSFDANGVTGRQERRNIVSAFSFVVVARATAVASCVTTTWAPAIGAPVGSVTVPVIAELPPPCANRRAANTTSRPASNKRGTRHLREDMATTSWIFGAELTPSRNGVCHHHPWNRRGRMDVMKMISA